MLRRSPVHHLLKANGACFGSRFGWERANWFAPGSAEPVVTYGWGRQNWFEPQRSAEHRAARAGVALFDQTSFAKIARPRTGRREGSPVPVHQRRRGPGRAARLHGAAQRSRRIRGRRHRDPHPLERVPIGYQQRPGCARPRPASPGASPAACGSSSWTSPPPTRCFSVMGPRSREFLQALCERRLLPRRLSPSATAARSTWQALRQRNPADLCGELGWELYVPTRWPSQPSSA